MMANNKMFLVHVPTGLAAPLGKRMAWGWYMSEVTQQKMGDRVALLFQVLEDEHSYKDRQDDFAVALEDASKATLATGKWTYGEPRDDGLVQLVMAPKQCPAAEKHCNKSCAPGYCYCDGIKEAT